MPMSGNRKRSAPTTKFLCCDELQQDNDVADTNKINKSQSVTEDMINASDTNNMLISMGDHDITYVPITMEQNIPIHSEMDLTSQIQDTDSQTQNSVSDLGIPTAVNQASLHCPKKPKKTRNSNVKTQRKQLPNKNKNIKKIKGTKQVSSDFNPALVPTGQSTNQSLQNNSISLQRNLGQLQAFTNSPSKQPKHNREKKQQSVSVSHTFPQIQVPTCVQQLLHHPVNKIQGHTTQPIQGLSQQPMDINSIQQVQVPVQQTIDMNQQSAYMTNLQATQGPNSWTLPTIPMQGAQQIQLDADDSSDESASSDEDDSLNQLGSNHVQLLKSMPAEGMNLNTMQFQFAEPISTAISLQIPHKIKKKIWRNQFIDLAILLPRTHLSNNNTNFQLQLSSKAQLSLVPNQNRKILSIETWTSAFLRFMAIYTEQFPMEAPQLLKYTEIVRDLARRSFGLSWYMYDQQFRMLRETVQIPWGRLHTEFWLMASNSPSQRPFRNNFRSSRNWRFNSQSRNKKFIEFTCWTYNRRGFCGDRACKFQHKCGLCRGPHPATNCTSQGKSAMQLTRGQNSNPQTAPSAPSSTVTSRNNNIHATTHSRNT